MKFMIIVKATPDSEAGRFPPDSDKLFAAMADYHEQLSKAGVLLDGSGLQPSSKGWRIRYDGDKRTVIDGPFAEAKELIAGYTLDPGAQPRRGAGVVAPLPQPGGREQAGRDRGAAAVRHGRLQGHRAARPDRAVQRDGHGVRSWP